VNGTSDQAATRLPGLDGLRALAVIAVIAFHEQLSAFTGGFLGVDVFFVLSGYLITDLLVAQWDRYGHLTLRGFWTKRARRLLPALGVLLVVVTAATAVIEPAQMTSLRDALLAQSPTPATGGRRWRTTPTSRSSGRRRRCSTCGHWPSRSSFTCCGRCC
jgi:peptidoglycan/LPS O-acetylase OafA/YrhL